MKYLLLLATILPILSACQHSGNSLQNINEAATGNSYPDVNSIPLPKGYKRINNPRNSFATWLRQIAIKKDKQVHLYNGSLKRNQSAQFAVLQVPVGNKDLQQCADAVMRLRAEYLYSLGLFRDISFTDNNGKSYNCPPNTSKEEFEHYLEKVFTWCGTASLEKQLKPVADFSNIQPGDVLIKGGFPGHAVIVVDVAVNNKGKKIYLLAQSYMPAQEIHILKNPMNDTLSPWYEVNEDETIYTPEWVFKKNQLRRF
ncbi:MAG: DUF4846 domain-containing protein [Chitinophagaceae bacterium]|nr:DUF4846 domain-containing protein [Chitinophagaceae bacterium]